MAQKPETTFSNSVNKHLVAGVYAEKTNNPYRAGIPDFYYEGNLDIIWTEYKFYPKLPPIIDLLNQKAKTKVSPLQERWMVRAHENGRHVAVILGWPAGGIIYDGLSWQHPLTREKVIKATIERKAIAAWIADQVLIGRC